MSATQPKIQTKDGKGFDIPLGGSLGLLALGFRGLMLWREKRNEVLIKEAAEKEAKKKNEEK